LKVQPGPSFAGMAAAPVPWTVNGRTCIVTGANTGIGKEVALSLASRGADVIMACRSMDKCRIARQEILSKGVPGRCTCMHLDLASLQSIESFADSVRKEHGRSEDGVALLVHNAGVISAAPSLETAITTAASTTLNSATATGGVSPQLGASQFHINHMGPFLMTRALTRSPSLLSRSGRVVVVGSQAHHRGSIAIDRNLALSPPEASSHWYAAYARSKLANLLFARELQRRLRAQGSLVDVFTASPGRVHTNLWSSIEPAPLRWIVQSVSRLINRTPAQGAQTILHACCDPSLTGMGGAYFHNSQIVAPSKQGCDDELAARLWELSEHVATQQVQAMSSRG